MNTKLFEAFSGLDQDLLDRSERPVKKNRRLLTGLLAAAACAAVAVALALPRMPQDGQGKIKNPVPDPWPGLEDPGIGKKPGDTQAPSTPPDVSVDPENPSVYRPTPPEDPQEPGVEDPMEYPTQPPELTYNEMEAVSVAPPAWLDDVTIRTPMSAYQLELVWSVECPTAFLEEGDGERYYYYNNVSGAAEYFSDGTLYRLALTFREEGNPVPVTVTLSPADGPLFTGCLPVEDGEADLTWSMGVVACRYDYGERILLAAETVIGDVRYRFTAETPPESEGEARNAVDAAVSRFQFIIFNKLSPRLDTFTAGDPTSGEPLVGRTLRTLFILEDKRGAEPAEYIVDRDGRVFGEQEDVLLSHGAQIELRELLDGLDAESASNACGHENEEFTMTLFNPWNRETGTVSGCVGDCEVIEKVVAILEREGVMA